MTEIRGNSDLHAALRDMASDGAGFYLDAPPDDRGLPRRWVPCGSCDAVVAELACIIATICRSCVEAREEAARAEGDPGRGWPYGRVCPECDPAECPTWYDGCHCADYPDLTMSAEEVEELVPCEFWPPERVRQVVAELSGGVGRAHLLDALRAPDLLLDDEALWLACRVLAVRAPWLLAAWRLHAARRLARHAPGSADAARAVEILAADLLVELVRAAGGSCGDAAALDERRALASALRREHYRELSSAGPSRVFVALYEITRIVADPHDLDAVLFEGHELGALPSLRAWRRHAARLVALASPGWRP